METRKELQTIEMLLIELIADYLDSERHIVQEGIWDLRDPETRKNSELHIRMANVALKEYEKTVFPKYQIIKEKRSDGRNYFSVKKEGLCYGVYKTRVEAEERKQMLELK